MVLAYDLSQNVDATCSPSGSRDGQPHPERTARSKQSLSVTLLCSLCPQTGLDQPLVDAALACVCVCAHLALLCNLLQSSVAPGGLLFFEGSFLARYLLSIMDVFVSLYTATPSHYISAWLRVPMAPQG